MKKLIALFLLFSFVANMALADANCDWTQIKKLPDGGYEYTPQLNLCVGNLVQQVPVLTQQVSDLTTAVQLKNAALLTSDQRTEIWMKTSQDEQTRLTQIDKDTRTNEYLAFGLGVAVTFLAAYAAAQVVHK